MSYSRVGSWRQVTAVGVVCAALLLAGVWQRPADAEVTAVSGQAFGYYVNVGLFGGPQTLRGFGQAPSAPLTAASPSVTLPPGGSETPIVATDPDGAKAQYGPAVIFGGIWPDHVSSAPQSGPMTVSTQGTPAGGSVTSSTDVTLFSPPNADAPGGIGPGPVIADRAQSSCTATESGVSGSATFTNGKLETKYDANTQLPIETETIPVNPPPNYTRSGTIDHVGDRYTVVFNEQIIGPDSITVNAVHLYLLGEVARGDFVVGSSTCSVESTVANAAPVATDDTYSTAPSTALTIDAPGLVGNDTDADGDALSATTVQAVFVPGPDHPAQSTGNTYDFPSLPENGTVTINADGSFTYTPNAGFTGTDSFDYVVRDPRGANASATVTITVTDVPPPTTTSTSTSTSTSLTIPDTSTSTSLTIPDTSTSTSLTIPGTSTSTSLTIPDTSTSTSSTIPDTSTSTSTTEVPGSTTSTTLPPEDDPCADATISGTAGADTIMGTSGDDVIAGLGGNDFIVGGGGNDTICGGDGNDTLDGRAGDDQIFGGAGADSLVGGAGNDFLDGGNGADDISGDADQDLLVGGNGEDKLRGGAGDDLSDGGADDDNITDGAGDDFLTGGAGDDNLRGGDGNDVLFGDEDDDRLMGEEGVDTLFGGDGDDRLNGGTGTDACDDSSGSNTLNNCEPLG